MHGPSTPMGGRSEGLLHPTGGRGGYVGGYIYPATVQSIIGGCAAPTNACCLSQPIPCDLYGHVYFEAFPPVCDFTFPLVFDPAATVSCSGGAFSQTGAWLASGVPFPGSCSGKDLQLYCVTPASAFWGLRIFDDVTPSGGCSQVVVSDCEPFFATWDDLVVGGANFSGGCSCSGIAQIFFTNDPTPPF